MKKVPVRSCVACQEARPKKELLRIVRTPDQEVLVDPGGKKSGRGAYLCYSTDCLKNAKKKNILERKLDTTIPEDIYSLIESEITAYNGKGQDS